MEGKLFIVQGTGNDSVGLVGQITTPIARANGNILDLRQDVIHGLFTIYIVVDLSGSELNIDSLRDILRDISNKTGLALFVDRYIPVPRSSRIKNVLLVLLGRDRPGIISTVSEKLSSYNINIELSQMIARGNVFLMDLMIDIQNSSIPIRNIREQLGKTMGAIGIHTMFQTEDVFNKKKKIIIFDIFQSFMSSNTFHDIMANTDVKREGLVEIYDSDDIDSSMKNAAAKLEGFPVDAIHRILDSIEIAPGTVELIQTLKLMGYKIGLISSGFSVFTDVLKNKLDIDYAFGYSLVIDSDSKSFTGEIEADSYSFTERNTVHELVMEQENVIIEDIAILDDRDSNDTPGIQVIFNTSSILEFYNQSVITRESLTGILGTFGFPRF